MNAVNDDGTNTGTDARPAARPVTATGLIAAVAEPGAAPVAGTGRLRRAVAIVLPVVLVLGGVGGAAAHTKNTVDNADRKATTTVWDRDHAPAGEEPAGGLSRGRHDTELAKLLLPVPEGYRLGPDIGELGNDSETSGAKATAAMKEMGRGLAGRNRRELDAFVERLRIRGVAQRSYVSPGNDLVANVQIVKMRDKRAVRKMFTDRKQLMDSFEVFRKGPRIEGHAKAACYRLPKGGKDTLDGVTCFAYDGEVSVSVQTFGSKPFSPSDAGDLVKDQLDHITSPGEYI